MLGVFAEFETNLRRERQMEGIAKAKLQGVYKGRKPTIDAGAVRALREAGKSPTLIARFEPNETWKLQSLGITFGDALAQKMRLRWVAVADQYGRDPALRDPGTTMVIFPLTAISKRVARGETVDIRDLFASFCADIERVRPVYRSH
jgi:hypothetical protein